MVKNLIGNINFTLQCNSFHDDDIYDAQWQKTFEWVVPESVKSGLYCAHIFDKNKNEDYIPFTVLPSKKVKKIKSYFEKITHCKLYCIC